MSKKQLVKKGFLLLEALLLTIYSMLMVYYFSTCLAFAFRQYDTIQKYNQAQHLLHKYTKKTQKNCAFVGHVIKKEPCATYTIVQEKKQKYIHTKISWHDSNDAQQSINSWVLPWNTPVDEL